MAWPGLPTQHTLPGLSSSIPSLSNPLAGHSADMKMYELTEHLRSMQLVQAEQSRRLDEQSYRLHQLEMKEAQTNRLENQRYLWGLGAVGSSAPVSKGLPGLGFDVFSSVEKEKEGEQNLKLETTSVTKSVEVTKNTIEHEIDNLLLSPSSVAKDNCQEQEEQHAEEPVSRAESQSPTNLPSNTINYFPYVLAIQCWLGGQNDAWGNPQPDQGLITAQINTAVHASFVDSALLHKLGVAHKIRHRRPPRYNPSYRSARPRILLPVYFPVDPSQHYEPCHPGSDQVTKIQVDFVVVHTQDLTPSDHQKLTSVEIGSQALFQHGIDVLFSNRTLRVSGISIPLPQIAPRDQKRLLSSIALPSFAPTTVPHQPTMTWERQGRLSGKETYDSEDIWPPEEQPIVRERDISTNSSISSTSALCQSASTTITSPSLPELSPNPQNKEDEPSSTNMTDLLTPPPTAGVFNTAALQFIPSSVVAKPAVANIKTIFEPESSSPSPVPEDDSSTPRSRSNTIETLNIPSRKSSLAQLDSSSTHAQEDDGPRLPSILMDKAVQRKVSATWPRSLGKKVAPWTSGEATKTSILGTQFDVVPPQRKMKILKPVRKGSQEIISVNGNEMSGSVAAGEEGQMKVQTKNVGGGAFHWMK